MRFTPDYLRRYLDAPDRWLDMLRVQDEAVGYCSYALTDTPDEVKLEQLYVTPSRHGQGLGGRMMRHVIARATALDRTTMILQVNKENHDAIAVYRKMGFTVREEARFDIGQGFFMDDYIMEKHLSITPAPVRALSPLTALIPFRRFVIESPLPLATAHARLAAAVAPTRWLHFGGARPFEGRVDDTSFEIRRIIFYGNGGRPRIRGTLVPAGTGTTVEGSMTLSPFTRVFLTIWFGGVLVGCVATLIDVATGERDPLVMIPFAMLAFGVLIIIGSFVFETRKALRLLSRVFGAAGG
jgi:diamine N-acetyltransferase